MTRAAKIGIFFTVCIISVSVYIVKSADNFTGGSTRVLYALSDDAMGLLNDSDIRIAGVVVGKMAKIELEDGKAKMTLNIWDEVDVYENARIEKVMESMLGTYVLVLDPGTKDARKLEEYEYIKNVISSSGINGAMDKASAMMEKATEAISILTTEGNQEK
ncbi:MAG TPA: MlaD family protein, partial [bacterium]|nr:MlaD family protein [bacterium]